MTPSLDREIGMGAHATSFAGCGGSIKRDASDFAVSEVLGEEAMEMSRGGDGYAVFVMKKSGIDTPHALQAVRRATGMRLKALGLKDARAVTEQYVCATSRSTRLALPWPCLNTHNFYSKCCAFQLPVKTYELLN